MVELVLLALFALATGVGAPGLLPAHLALGDVLLFGSAFVLLQGLARDLTKLVRSRAASGPAAGAPRMVCVCAESTVGVLGIVAGGAILFAGLSPRIDTPPVAWAIGVMALGLLGFAAKDLVLELKGFRIRRVKDHRVVVGRAP